MFLKFFRGAVWFADFGTKEESKFCEQFGKRPCVIISNNYCNAHSNIITVLPITSQVKTILPTHLAIPRVADSENSTNIVLGEQIRTISKDRLSNMLGMLDEQTMKAIDEIIMIQCGLKEATKQAKQEVVTEKKPAPFEKYPDEYKQKFLEESKTMSIKELAAKYNIDYKTAWHRVKSWTLQ